MEVSKRRSFSWVWQFDSRCHWNGCYDVSKAIDNSFGLPFFSRPGVSGTGPDHLVWGWELSVGNTSSSRAGTIWAPAGLRGSRRGACPLQPSLGNCNCSNGAVGSEEVGKEELGTVQPFLFLSLGRAPDQGSSIYPGNFLLHPLQSHLSPWDSNAHWQIAVTPAGLVMTSNHTPLIWRHWWTEFCLIYLQRHRSHQANRGAKFSKGPSDTASLPPSPCYDSIICFLEGINTCWHTLFRNNITVY